ESPLREQLSQPVDDLLRRLQTAGRVLIRTPLRLHRGVHGDGSSLGAAPRPVRAARPSGAPVSDRSATRPPDSITTNHTHFIGQTSSVLRAGNRAALIRPSPPWLSRALT